MKFLATFSALIVFLFANAQQQAFFSLEKDDTIYHGRGFLWRGLDKLFTDTINYPLAGVKNLCIFEYDLANLDKYDLSRLTALEYLVVRIDMETDTAFKAKQKFIHSVSVLMKNMDAFLKCPNLETVIFSINCHVYISKEDDRKWRKGEYGSDAGWEELEKKSMVIAWETFGKEVNRMLPGIKLYGMPSS